jgi:Protein of unknown function (DUF2510)
METSITPSSDAKRWGPGDMVVGGATFVLFIALFLPWFSISGFGVLFFTESAVGAHGWMYLVLLLSLAILGYLVARPMWQSTRLPLPHWQALLGATGLNLVLTLICLLSKPYGTSLSYGASIGLLAALVAVVGAVVVAVTQSGQAETLPNRPTSTPAGWYPDTAVGVQRYWDGQRWTEHTAPL